MVVSFVLDGLSNTSNLRRIIDHECVNISREEDVLDAVLEWINYDAGSRTRQLSEVLSAVQWPLVRDRSRLEEMLCHPAVLVDPKCLAMVREAARYHDLSYEDKLRHWAARDRPSR